MDVKDRLSHSVFALCASFVIIALLGIFAFVSTNAYQTFTVDHISPSAFFFGSVWQPEEGKVGALVLIVGSAVATALAVLLSAPFSTAIAVFMTEIAPGWMRHVIRPILELLTGVPSIIYGFAGLQLVVPLISKIYNGMAGGFFTAGYGILAAAIVLAIMILPTIATLSVDALDAVPNNLREASLALGATRWQTIFGTVLPSASSGIFAAIILGMGRAIGETLAVSFVIGSNANSFPLKIDNVYPYVHLYPTSTITVQLLFDFKEAVNGTLNYHAIWTLAFILLTISMLLVIASRRIAARSVFAAQGNNSRRPWDRLRRAISRPNGRTSTP